MPKKTIYLIIKRWNRKGREEIALLIGILSENLSVLGG